jgi:hypothetical protein
VAGATDAAALVAVRVRLAVLAFALVAVVGRLAILVLCALFAQVIACIAQPRWAVFVGAALLLASVINATLVLRAGFVKGAPRDAFSIHADFHWAASVVAVASGLAHVLVAVLPIWAVRCRAAGFSWLQRHGGTDSRRRAIRSANKGTIIHNVQRNVMAAARCADAHHCRPRNRTKQSHVQLHDGLLSKGN